MNTYNMDFLFAALFLLILVLYHYMSQKKLDSEGNRIFRFFIGVGIADVIFDILCTLLMMQQGGAWAELTKFCLTVFYILQVTVPLALVMYAQRLRNAEKRQALQENIVSLVLPAIMITLIFINYWGGMFFWFDSEGVYHRGPWYMLMYYYAFLYAVAVGLITLIYRRELTAEKKRILWEFLLIELLFTAVQAFTGTCLTTGFGIAVGIMVLYLTIDNPNTYTDYMTGVFGNAQFRKWFQEKREKKEHIHVISIDVVSLKWINKVYGNSVGDRLLLQIAEELGAIADNVSIFRIAGKRFFLVLKTLSDYERCREKVKNLFEQVFVAEGEQIPCRAVICGIVNGEKLTEETLIAYVDYMAARVEDAKETVLIQSNEKIMDGFIYEQEIEKFLTTAIEQDLFEVYYQPVYSVKTGQYVTLEALSRLHHPTLGYIPPNVFITLAEKNGQITRIGQLQFRRICSFVKKNEWIMKRIHNIKVNLSPLELLKYGHWQSLVEIIREYGLSFSYFEFEITETAATEYSENLSQMVDTFHKLGIGLCLDDFGSGYANMSTVLKLPFSSIKIDQSLLRDVEKDAQAAVFYQNIVKMFQKMGYQIVAEGAETLQETELLEQWGVDMIQGYYFSRPVCAEQIMEMLGMPF